MFLSAERFILVLVFPSTALSQWNWNEKGLKSSIQSVQGIMSDGELCCSRKYPYPTEGFCCRSPYSCINSSLDILSFKDFGF